MAAEQGQPLRQKARRQFRCFGFGIETELGGVARGAHMHHAARSQRHAVAARQLWHKNVAASGRRCGAA